jgi:hypothetical protein
MKDLDVLKGAAAALTAKASALLLVANDSDPTNDRPALVDLQKYLDEANRGLTQYLVSGTTPAPEEPPKPPEYPPIDYSKYAVEPYRSNAALLQMPFYRPHEFDNGLPPNWSWPSFWSACGLPDPNATGTGRDDPKPDMSGPSLDAPGRRENAHLANVSMDYTFTPRASYTHISLGGNFRTVKYRVFGPGQTGALRVDTKSGSIPSWDISLSGLSVGALYRLQLATDQATILAVEKNPK